MYLRTGGVPPRTRCCRRTLCQSAPLHRGDADESDRRAGSGDGERRRKGLRRTEAFEGGVDVDPSVSTRTASVAASPRPATKTITACSPSDHR